LSKSFLFYKICSLLWIGLFFITSYIIVGKYYVGTPQLLPKIWIDHAIPFTAWTFWIYTSYYYFLVLGCLLMPDKKSFQRLRNAFFAILFFHIGLFCICPTYIILPNIIGNDWSSALGRWIQSMDETTKCFPSLHVSVTFLVSFSVSYYFKKLLLLINIWALAIAISTLTTGQHYFYDVVSGFTVALVAFVTFYYIIPKYWENPHE